MAQIRLRDATNALHTVARIRIRDAGNVLRVVQRIRVRDAGNVLRMVYAALTAAITDAAPTGAANNTTITTTSTTASGVGGVGPFTYAWTRQSFSGCSAAVVSNTTAATVYFSFSGVPIGGTGVASWICVVTDTATTATASIGCAPTGNDLGAPG